MFHLLVLAQAFASWFLVISCALHWQHSKQSRRCWKVFGTFGAFEVANEDRRNKEQHQFAEDYNLKKADHIHDIQWLHSFTSSKAGLWDQMCNDEGSLKLRIPSKKKTQLVMDPLCNHLHPEAHWTWWVVKVNRMSMASKCPAAPYKIVSVEICICPKDDIDCGRGAFAATKAGCWTTADCWNLCRERERRGKKKNVYRAPWYTYLFYFMLKFTYRLWEGSWFG